MDKRTDRTKPDVDSMADQQDQQHAYRTQHDVHALRHIYSQLVEYTPKIAPVKPIANNRIYDKVSPSNPEAML